MKKLLIAALVVLFACRGHSDSAKDKKASIDLPVPTKLPPAPLGSAVKPGENHAAAIDNEYATVLAMYKAPEGATPCESLYNAIAAEQDAAKTLKRESIFTFVAPKAELMKRCQAMPAAAQRCLVPAYQAKHAGECESARAPDADVAKLYALRADLEPPKESGQQVTPQ